MLARKLSLPNMCRKCVLAAGLTQFVQGLAKRRSVTLKEAHAIASDARLQPLLHPRHNNSPIRQQNDEIHLSQWSFDRV
jgi:hypothetical protein